KPGDTIEPMEDVAVVSSIDLERSLLVKGAGEKVTAQVARADGTETLEVALEQTVSKPLGAAEVVWKRLGMKVQPVGPAAVARANPQLHGGLVVTDVVPGGAAATAGINKGDILIGLHSWETLRVDD